MTTPRLADTTPAHPLRWGILGTGNIARQFARDLAALPRQTLTAVASRSADSAEKFANDFEADVAYAGYEAILSDDAVDAVYISLPNTMHAEWATRCLEAGKHVLCEKPMATSEGEARQMFAAATKAGRLLVEAFMYRCHPQTLAVMSAISRGELGTVTAVRTSFVYRTTKIDDNIRFDPDLAGGALMDVGCYCLDFTRQIASAASAGGLTAVAAASRKHATGVDVMTSGLLQFESGLHATFTCGMDSQTDNSTIITGTNGYLTIGWPWKPPADKAGHTLHRGVPPKQDLKPGEKAVAPPPQWVPAPAEVPLYALEAEAFAAAVHGEADPFMPADETLANHRLIDEIRRLTT